MRQLKKLMVMVLTVAMLFTSCPMSAPTALAEGPSPQKVVETAGKYAEAMSKFMSITGQMSTFEKIVTASCGLTSATAGCLGVLQMIGVIQDPTLEAIGQVLEVVRDIQTKIDSMDGHIKEIQEELAKLSSDEIIRFRSSQANDMLNNWYTFNTNYCESLDRYMDEYKNKVDVGVRDAWERGALRSGSLGAFAVYDHNPIKDDNILLVPRGGGTTDVVPAGKAENGDDIGYVVCFPRECLPDTTKVAFDINTYRDDYVRYVTQHADRIEVLDYDAGDTTPHPLSDAQYPSPFRDDDQRQSFIEKVAHDLLNTQIYYVSCDLMSADSAWVTGVRSKYREYCNNVLNKNSGIDAMLNAMYLTHGFEGEIKEDIDTFCDSMVAKTGVYGLFALNCACQCDMVAKEDREEIQRLFTDTIDRLSDKKAKAKKGHDNYSYITGTLLEFHPFEVKSTLTMHLAEKLQYFDGVDSTPWDLTSELPPIVDSIYIQVMYSQYMTEGHGMESFATYLKEYGVGEKKADPTSSTIITKYRGQEVFPFDEGIAMTAYRNLEKSSYYFAAGETFRIDVGTDEDVDRDCYIVHDKVVCDIFDMADGKLSLDAAAAAKACYGQNKIIWFYSEAWTFATSNAVYQSSTRRYDEGLWEKTDCEQTFTVGLDALKSTAVNDMGEADVVNSNDPFFSFGGPTLTPGVSDNVTPMKPEQRTPITDVRLDKDTYTHTGKPIEPTVTVLAGERTVPAGDYSVSYVDNTDIGDATVIVRGLNGYGGTVARTFEIVPEGAIVTPNNRVFDGTARPLVNVDESTMEAGQTMYYALGTDDRTVPDTSAFTTSVPVASAPGTYYVWYKAKGADGRDVYRPLCVVCEIAEAGPSPSPTPMPSPTPVPVPSYQSGSGYGHGSGYSSGSGSGYSSDSSSSVGTSQPARVASDKVRRISGADRYATAAAVSAEGFAGSTWAVVATGSSFPDALAASALAGAHRAPVILTDGGALSPQAASELGRLGVTDTLVVGGASAVSDAVVSSIEAMGIRVTRIAGADRYETSTEALRALREADPSSDTVVVASGAGFADALSIGPWAWATRSPVLLARPDGTLSQSAVDAIRADGGIRRVVIVGGTAAVPDGLADQLGESFEYVRLGAEDRFGTSRLVADFAAREGMGWSTVGVATGMAFPDALAASAFIGKRGGVLLLTDANGDSVADAVRTHASSIGTAYVLGGNSAVPVAVADKLSSALS